MRKKAIPYLKGYVRIRISGNKTEHFLNLCSQNNIAIWDLLFQNYSYEMNITVNDLKKIKPIVRKTKIKFVIIERYGFPFFLHKYRKRKFFIYGFFLCIFLIYYLSGFIWNIQFSGNSSYTTETLLKYLHSISIERGMKVSDVNCSQIVSQLRDNFNDIIWVSASIKGSNLKIEIKENENSDIDVTKNRNQSEEAYDIRATGDYIISKLIVRKGIPMKKEGDMVKKGEILVSGQIPVYNDAKEITGYQYCISDADIRGIQKIFYENNISKYYYNKIFNDIRKQEYFLKVGKYCFSFGSTKNNYSKFLYITKQSRLLPFIYGIRTVLPYETQKKEYSSEEIRTILTKEFNNYCNNLKKKGVVILQNDVKIYTWSDTAYAYGYLTIEKNIGQIKLSEQIEAGDIINGNDGNYN